MSSADRYEAKSEVDGLEALSKKLVSDLRKHIRSLGAFPVMSERWCLMAESLSRIANVSSMEKALPKASEDATLWECEELALRYLLEDGKLNLCLRILIEFKEYQRAADAIPDEDVAVQEKFEKGAGIVLRNAWQHVEAVQTTDLPALMGHIADVLADAVERPERLADKELTNLQEAVVGSYLEQLFKNLDDIDESRILPTMKRRRVLPNFVALLHRRHDSMSGDELDAAARALAYICGSEDFETDEDIYLPDDDARSDLVALRDDFVDDLVEDPDVRKQLRPLLDAMRDSARMLSK
eukprot:PLAT13960.1.p2 GENE.PLAT13960.1~~PLAT13960.1.p2  ORF type:complete len:304 (-),score=161.81 PLAT13960.1:134-1024(-)